MRTGKYLVAGGNPTLLVWDCPENKKELISQQYLESGEVEQIGFVTVEHGVMYLFMMGNELCINAALALASDNGGSGKFFTRGLDTFIMYSNDDRTTVETELPYQRDGDTILFDGIGFTCLKEDIVVTKDVINDLAKRHNLPAFGIVICKNNVITPHVYVVKTDSLVHESACGSGSIAASIVLGIEDIVQPSGETIEVTRNGNNFKISAKAIPITYNPSNLVVDTSQVQDIINDKYRNIL